MSRLPMRGLLGAGLEDGALHVEMRKAKRVLEHLYQILWASVWVSQIATELVRNRGQIS